MTRLATVYRLECDHCHTGPFQHESGLLYGSARLCPNNNTSSGPTTWVNPPCWDPALASVFTDDMLCGMDSLDLFREYYLYNERSRDLWSSLPSKGWAVRALQIPEDRVYRSRREPQVLFHFADVVRSVRVTDLELTP